VCGACVCVRVCAYLVVPKHMDMDMARDEAMRRLSERAFNQ
jgi:hypothetical protein